MASNDKTPKSSSPTPPPSSNWEERILFPTLIAGVVGGLAGLVSRHRTTLGTANICVTYAANLSIVTGCYCGAREFVAATRRSDDLINSALGGFGSGAFLGRLQGGKLGAVKYSIIFAIAGTTADFAVLQLKPHYQRYRESIFGNNESSKQKSSWLSMPEWSPIKVLDEEALAKKREREQQLCSLSNPSNEQS
ncbi:hypothetical protein GIB67_028934 [Kingdonia uniflora]|uniref:Uncharacterized protein n=1 Tax=Kingdonia uniflora TaxID=39325 RepID=A0A7J7LC17_9MAGN|nr:hypothetical protein GIB67_028934 [Kingdonia uniflora]